jgi:hypothetical protein
MRRVALMLLVTCGLTTLAAAADHDVDALVGAIEREYGLHHTNLPWIARAAMKPALWGKGVSLNLKLFEDQPLPESASVEIIDRLTGKSLDPSWCPFIRAHSRRDGERTVIYVKPEGKHLLMLIVSAERRDTTVVKMKVNASDARNWMEDPEGMSARKHKRLSHADGSEPAD